MGCSLPKNNKVEMENNSTEDIKKYIKSLSTGQVEEMFGKENSIYLRNWVKPDNLLDGLLEIWIVD
jgi:hypothetical protein